MALTRQIPLRSSALRTDIIQTFFSATLDWRPFPAGRALQFKSYPWGALDPYGHFTSFSMTGKLDVSGRGRSQSRYIKRSGVSPRLFLSPLAVAVGYKASSSRSTKRP